MHTVNAVGDLRIVGGRFSIMLLHSRPKIEAYFLCTKQPDIRGPR
jgi:hypothetical protein